MLNNNLGKGSFGKTVLLHDPFIDELFVAKKYEPEYEGIKEKFFQNFLDEIKILYKLNHKNIVRIFNYYAYEGLFTGYILMEYIEGINIAEYINDITAQLLEVSPDDVFSQLIDGFSYIEKRGIIHRDIREGNILINKQGEVKIIDFGIGKICENIENVEDSLVGNINRKKSDTLPQEYFEGIYTSKTDMFYLGELLNRLMSCVEGTDALDFSYQHIIDKMMMKNPLDRYESFSKIKDVMNECDFINLDISQEDKNIYQNFATPIRKALSSYMDEIKLNSDIELFILKLEKVLEINCFEDEIQNNKDVIDSLVVGGYYYRKNVVIRYSVVKEFLNWFRNLNVRSQQLVFANLISKISNIKVEINRELLPF